ncbi:MAG: hypothetical protein LBE97_00705 [Holosporales bacterium]|nr:hypothetical protein [Holosporales bacterium]
MLEKKTKLVLKSSPGPSPIAAKITQNYEGIAQLWFLIHDNVGLPVKLERKFNYLHLLA